MNGDADDGYDGGDGLMMVTTTQMTNGDADDADDDADTGGGGDDNANDNDEADDDSDGDDGGYDADDNDNNNTTNKLICRAPLFHRQASPWRFTETHAYMHLTETTVTHEHSLTCTPFVHSFRKRVELEGKQVGY